MILALETSCDDTCAALVGHDGTVHANVISSQEVHDRFGGVVPEIAARQHVELIDAVVGEAFARAGVGVEAVSLVAATRGPGLVGALLVGFCAAKGFAAARELPFAAVDHLSGHIAAAYLAPARFEPPFLALIASGGHTLLLDVPARGRPVGVLARTLDDAAGEAFDKGARMLGLGYPGGAALSRLAADGDPRSHAFPVGRGADFSFAGLKTALLYRIRDLTGEVDRGATERARSAPTWPPRYGGQSSRRSRAASRASSNARAWGGWRSAAASRRTLRCARGMTAEPRRGAVSGGPDLCTDNAAMIASAARDVEALAYPDYLSLDVYATGEGPLR